MPEITPEISWQPPLMHILLMAKSGGGKSTLCATFPKPMLVMSCDPVGKEVPYLERGQPGGVQKGEYCFYQDVMSKKTGEQIIRIEYWGEHDPFNPTAYPRWMKRTANLEKEIVKEGYKTVILDTLTFFEYSARAYSEHNINKEVKDGRQHYGFSAHACEQYVAMRWPNMILCNTIVCCHVADEKTDDDTEGLSVVKKMVAAPGQVPNKLPGAYGEVWRPYYAGKDAQGNAVYLLQTAQRPTNGFECKSLLRVADGITPHYDAIIADLKAKALANK